MKIRPIATYTEGSPCNVELVLKRVVALLHLAKIVGRIQLSIISDNGSSRWCLDCGAGTVALSTRIRAAQYVSDHKPDVEVVFALNTFRKIISGDYAPTRAFLDGRLRLRGDEALAKRAARALGSSKGSLDCHDGWMRNAPPERNETCASQAR